MHSLSIYVCLFGSLSVCKHSYLFFYKSKCIHCLHFSVYLFLCLSVNIPIYFSITVKMYSLYLFLCLCVSIPAFHPSTLSALSLIPFHECSGLVSASCFPLGRLAGRDLSLHQSSVNRVSVPRMK